jgi:hypothetical protein
MGLIFLRHAYSRFLAVKNTIEADLPQRGGKTRALSKEDFSQKSAIFLQPKAQFDHLVALTGSDDRAKAIIDAMESIEGDYENLRGVLPKSEYQELEVESMGILLPGPTIEEMKQGTSRIRNPVIARVFKELHLIEQWGTGVRRIFAEALELGLPEPKIEEIALRLRFTVYLAKPHRIPADTSKAMAEEQVEATTQQD